MWWLNIAAVRKGKVGSHPNPALTSEPSLRTCQKGALTAQDSKQQLLMLSRLQPVCVSFPFFSLFFLFFSLLLFYCHSGYAARHLHVHIPAPGEKELPVSWVSDMHKRRLRWNPMSSSQTAGKNPAPTLFMEQEASKIYFKVFPNPTKSRYWQMLILYAINDSIKPFSPGKTKNFNLKSIPIYKQNSLIMLN